MSAPLPYRDDVEQLQPGEDEDIRRCIESLRRTNAMTFDLHRHAYRGTHAKSHGILRGHLTVHDDLPPELAQGLFATPGGHPVVVRIATETGQLDDDRKRNARGLALKVFDVDGETLEPGRRVHDFLFNTLPVLPPGTARTFREITEIREAHFSDPDAIAAEIGARPDGAELGAFERLPVLHPVANSFYTQSAFRYGDHVAKLALHPHGAAQQALGAEELSDAEHRGVLGELLQAWATEHETAFDLRVQLRTDAETMPVEDAAVEWPEDQSPYRSVGTVRLPPQQPYSPARRTFADDRLAFRPWHGLRAHRPLGSVNRLRERAYEVLGAQRFALNAVEGTEMTSPDELPD